MRMPHQGPKQGPPPDQEYQEPGAPGDDPQAPGEEGNQGEPPVMNPAYANQPPMPPGPSPQKSGWGAMPYGGNMAGGPSTATTAAATRRKKERQEEKEQQRTAPGCRTLRLFPDQSSFKLDLSAAATATTTSGKHPDAAVTSGLEIGAR